MDRQNFGERHVYRDEGYRQRCRDTITKWRKLFEDEGKARSQPGDSKAEPTYEEIKAQVERLEKQVRGRLQFKVSEKGGVSVYGLGRFPLTLYYEQWMRLLGSTQELRDFLETNNANLKRKEPLR